MHSSARVKVLCKRLLRRRTCRESSDLPQKFGSERTFSISSSSVFLASTSKIPPEMSYLLLQFLVAFPEIFHDPISSESYSLA